MVQGPFDVGDLVQVLYGPQGGLTAEVLGKKPVGEWEILYRLGFSPGTFVAPGNEWQPGFMIKRMGQVSHDSIER